MSQERVRKKKIRILHLVNSLRVGGAEIALFHYINALGNDSYEHYVYCLETDGPIRKKLESLRIFIYIGKKRASIKRPIKFGCSLWSLTRHLIAFIKTRRIQVIQSHSGMANQLTVAIGKLARISAFPTVHSTMAFVDQRSRLDFRVFLIKVVNGIIYRLAEKVLAVSQEVKEIVLKTYGLRDSKVIVLRNGIVFDDASTKTANLDNEFPLSKNKFTIIAAGRLVAWKCFDILIKAVSEAVNSGTDNILVLIAGDGRERSRLQGLIKTLELESYVKLLGLRDDVIEIMKASHAFVIPSRYEGLSIAMIEAMACGLPVIASNVPGLKDNIKNGINGLLFSLEDYKELASHIRRLAYDENLRNKLSRGAIDTFAKKYDMNKNIKPLDLLFQQYANQNAKFHTGLSDPDTTQPFFWL